MCSECLPNIWYGTRYGSCKNTYGLYKTENPNMLHFQCLNYYSSSHTLIKKQLASYVYKMLEETVMMGDCASVVAFLICLECLCLAGIAANMSGKIQTNSCENHSVACPTYLPTRASLSLLMVRCFF